MDQRLERKISVKTVVGSVDKNELPETGSKPLMHVIGHAQRVKEGTSDYGIWQKLLGQFEAVNLETGEVVVSPQCILPEPINGMIAGQLIGDDKVESVSFAVEIGAKASGRAGGTGYEFTSKPLVEASEADPLADLRSKVKLLTNDKPEPKSEPKSEREKKGGKK